MKTGNEMTLDEVKKNLLTNEVKIVRQDQVVLPLTFTKYLSFFLLFNHNSSSIDSSPHIKGCIQTNIVVYADGITCLAHESSFRVLSDTVKDFWSNSTGNIKKRKLLSTINTPFYKTAQPTKIFVVTFHAEKSQTQIAIYSLFFSQAKALKVKKANYRNFYCKSNV